MGYSYLSLHFTRIPPLLQKRTVALLFGANGIIGVRYDANDVMEGITEVLAYGTAVVLEKAQLRLCASLQGRGWVFVLN
jgi:hypothetical protein